MDFVQSQATNDEEFYQLVRHGRPREVCSQEVFNAMKAERNLKKKLEQKSPLT